MEMLMDSKREKGHINECKDGEVLGKFGGEMGGEYSSTKTATFIP